MDSVSLNNFVSFSRRIEGECTILKIIDDLIIAGSKTGNIVCWNIESGEEIWNLDFEGPCSDIDYDNENIYVAESDKIHRIEFMSGELIWSKSIGGASDYLFADKDKVWVTSSTYTFEIQDYEDSNVILFDKQGKVECTWEISGKAWFIYVRSGVAFVGLSGPNVYAELKKGLPAKYFDLENRSSIVSGGYSKMDEIVLGHSNGGITKIKDSKIDSFFNENSIKSVIANGGWVASFESGEIISNREIGNWVIDMGGSIDFISFGPSLNENNAIWSSVWMKSAFLKIIDEKTGMVEIVMRNDERIVKIHIADEIIALGDIYGKIMILETEVVKSRIDNYEEDENIAKKRSLLRSRIEKLLRE